MPKVKYRNKSKPLRLMSAIDEEESENIAEPEKETFVELEKKTYAELETIYKENMQLKEEIMRLLKEKVKIDAQDRKRGFLFPRVKLSSNQENYIKVLDISHNIEVKVGELTENCRAALSSGNTLCEKLLAAGFDKIAIESTKKIVTGKAKKAMQVYTDLTQDPIFIKECTTKDEKEESVSADEPMSNQSGSKSPKPQRKKF